MKTVFEEEEELAQPDPQPDRELTISSTTLLAIFFGLVLICGLFFGLGYTLGRRSPSEAALLPSGSSTSDQQALPGAAKPSPTPQPVVAAAPTPATDDTQAMDGSATSTPQDEAAAPQVKAPQVKTSLPSTAAATPAVTAPSSVKPALQAATPSAAPTQQPVPVSPSASQPSTASGIMVQIAAISNPTDADVLVGALQKRGYSVTARRSSGDALIHVQVGPFSNRADAIAMRQKLLGDGYNAILK